MGKKRGYEIKLGEKQITKISTLLGMSTEKLDSWLNQDALLREFKKKNIFPWTFLNSAYVRRIIDGKHAYSKICFNDIFIEPNEYTTRVLRNALEKSRTQKGLYEILDIEYNWKQLDNFLNKRNWLPLSVFEKVVDFLGINESIEDILEKCRIRSHSGDRDIIKYKPDITPNLARILGFILTDGSIAISTPKVILSQKDKTLSYEYARELCDFFGLPSNKIQISDDTIINSSALRYVLIRFFDIPLGAKITQLRIPSKILKSENKAIIKYFIAGVFDGDGCVTRYKKKIPEFCITSASNKFLNWLKGLLDKISIKSKITLREDCSQLRIRNQYDSIKFFVEICPLLNGYRNELADSIFSQSDILDRVRIDKTNEISNLINKSIEAAGGRTKLGRFLMSKGIFSNPISLGNWNRIKLSQKPTLKGIIEINKFLKNDLTFGLRYPYSQFVRTLDEIQKYDS